MKYVKTNIGNVPLEDFLDIKAGQYGYDNYEDLVADGMKIEIAEEDIIEMEEC